MFNIFYICIYYIYLKKEATRLFTFRFGHHDSKESDGSVDVAEPATVKAEEDGGLGDHRRLVAHPGTEGGHRRTYIWHRWGGFTSPAQTSCINLSGRLLRSIMVRTLSRASSLVTPAEMTFTDTR